MAKNLLYFAPEISNEFLVCHIDSMGIHEEMKPRKFYYYPKEAEYLLIIMHSEPQISGCSHYAILYTPKALREYGSSCAAWDHSWILLRGDALRYLIDKHDFPCNEKLNFVANEMMEEFFRLLYEDLNSKKEQIDLLIEAMLNVILTQILVGIRHHDNQIPENLIKAKEYMMNNVKRPISLEDIAQEASLSVSRFIPLFKRYYNETPNSYLIHYRMLLATRLLSQKGSCCKAVALELGFQDQLYFSRCFHKQFGISPSSYQKNHNADKI